MSDITAGAGRYLGSSTVESHATAAMIIEVLEDLRGRVTGEAPPMVWVDLAYSQFQALELNKHCRIERSFWLTLALATWPLDRNYDLDGLLALLRSFRPVTRNPSPEANAS